MFIFDRRKALRRVGQVLVEKLGGVLCRRATEYAFRFVTVMSQAGRASMFRNRGNCW